MLVIAIILLLLIVLCSRASREQYTVFRRGGFTLNPNFWGPDLWRSIHSVAYGFPDNPSDEEKAEAKKFIYSLPDILPCKECQTHFKDNLKKLPPEVDSKIDFFNWTIDIHNIVNQQLGKPIRTREEIHKHYKDLYSTTCDKFVVET